MQLCPTGAGCAAAPTNDYLNKLDGTLEVTLNSTGDYKVGADVGPTRSWSFLLPPGT